MSKPFSWRCPECGKLFTSYEEGDQHFNKAHEEGDYMDRDMPSIGQTNVGHDVPYVDGQLAVFQRAHDIYKDRAPKYGNAWERNGWRGTILSIFRKADRIRAMYWLRSDQATMDLDDLYDLINYTAFTIRLMEDGNEFGN